MESYNFVPQTGMSVIGSDGGKVGEIDAVEQDYFVVRKGMFFPSDHYIPFSAVETYDDDAVYLSVTKEEALDQQWGQPPVASTDAYAESTFEDDSYATDRIDRNVGTYDDDTTIEVREETLAARTREVERGAVRVEKHVIEEEQTLEVPVTEEEVHIERRAESMFWQVSLALEVFCLWARRPVVHVVFGTRLIEHRLCRPAVLVIHHHIGA